MYDHYIGLDWAQQNMAVARITKHSDKAKTIDVPSDIGELKLYLKALKGRKIITFEESGPAQWLYTELLGCVDKIIVCDPYRNHLLKEGGKSDKTDAEKLAKLLKNNLVKPVFHCTEEFIDWRKLVSGYQDLVCEGVRLKNQRSAFYRAQGKKPGEPLESFYDNLVITSIENRIRHYEEEKSNYEHEFDQLRRDHTLLYNLSTIPGIGPIGAVTIASAVVDAHRFKNKSAFLVYSGLLKLELVSGGRSYGQRSPRCNRRLKQVFKTAALNCTQTSSEKNLLKKYFDYLITEKQYPVYQARHAVAQRVAILTLGVMKTGKKFDRRLIEKKFKKLTI